MLIDIITIFPEMVDAPLRWGVLGRGREEGILRVRVHNLRDFTHDRHSVTDEPPYGGGPGMLMKPGPFFRAVEHCRRDSSSARVVLVTPQGRRLTHALCEEMAREKHLIILCPRYEGVDERVRQWVVTHEVSIGDYVLSGGEIAALVVADAVGRLIPGVVGEASSVQRDSFSDGDFLEGPQYTRPRKFRHLMVPEILLSGDHGAVKKWHCSQAAVRTRRRRPDLLERR